MPIPFFEEMAQTQRLVALQLCALIILIAQRVWQQLIAALLCKWGRNFPKATMPIFVAYNF